ncbi:MULTISPECIES: MaoC family dehydratase N-terminal domain-containing protein [unclassified Rhodococcus (in: high G+C Gram-positive bacteria)]|uniref:FAS1-like dehydratase domain-containing protein n=1 Tax=unclassified Rhodococcus (in: high G+C Gram-positive bacteria) TaxID=192944 RepID=UPI0027E1B7B1|nr:MULTISPECIES: MaoC family dehydratase N-terminal domain-containing protein [unclassified Rhodococcus (in: high G+C Gram-positive bacteria)]
MSEGHITDSMRSVIGKEYSTATSFPVSESDIRRWAMATYYPDPPPRRYWDSSSVSSIVAPEDFNPFAWMTAAGPQASSAVYDPDDHFTKLGVDGPGLERQVNGGLEVSYGEPIKPGDVITSSAAVSALSEREGRLGLMLFTTFETTWTNQTGAEVRRQKMTIIRY